MILARLLKPKNLARSNRNNQQPRYITVPQRKAGIVVDHDVALNYSAVYGCTRVISETIASLPWHVFTRQTNGRERSENSRVEAILNRRPNPEMSPGSFKETITAHALTWGNGYAEIERDFSNRPVALWIISPDRVQVKRDEVGVLYEVLNQSGPKTYFRSHEIYHLHGLGYDGLQGYSVVSRMAQSIGLGLAAEEFGASFFGNGATLGGAIELPVETRLGDEAKQAMVNSFNAKYQGSANAHKIGILDGGATFKEIGVPPEDAQMLETRKFQVEDICRWFRVPPHKVASLDRATFSNIEHQSIEFVTDTILPWVSRLEQEADYKLFGAANLKQYTKLGIEGLLRGDSAARAEWYREMMHLGVYSINEVRAKEDENGIGPEGDKRFMQTSMTTIDKIGQDEPEPRVDPGQPLLPNELEQETVENTIRPFLLNEKKRFANMKRLYIRESDTYRQRALDLLNGTRDKLVDAIEAQMSTLVRAHGFYDHADQVAEAASLYAEAHINVSFEMAKQFFESGEYEVDERAKSNARQIMAAIEGLKHA